MRVFVVRSSFGYSKFELVNKNVLVFSLPSLIDPGVNELTIRGRIGNEAGRCLAAGCHRLSRRARLTYSVGIERYG